MPDPKTPRAAKKTTPAKKTTARKAAAPKAQAAPPTTEPVDSMDSVANDAAALFGSYLKDTTKTASESLSKIQEGSYKVENAWADGIKMWSSYVTGMSKAFELGTRAVKTYATKSDDAG